MGPSAVNASTTKKTTDAHTPLTLAAPDRPDRSGVQGMIYAGFGSLPAGRYLLLRITDAGAARAWISRVADQITGAPAPGTRSSADAAVQLAFTATGFTALGVRTEGQDFSRPFVEGMVTTHRSRILGDVDEDAPTSWRWGGPASPVDVLVIALAADDAALDALVEGLGIADAGSGLEVVHAVPTRMLPDAKEHFGFTDGISQPRFAGEEGTAAAHDSNWSAVAPGEIVLGAIDQAAQRAPVPTVASNTDRAGTLAAAARGQVEFGRDGTYLVLRQLHQDVAGFRTWTLEQSGGDAAAAAELASKAVGRRQDGTPLVACDDAAGQNDFGFANEDPTGLACPIGAHVRRANPRDGRRGLADETSQIDPAATLKNTKRHRLLRRGRAYGPPLPEGEVVHDGAERGLLFVALNADIERQFEFVQHHWLNSATLARPGEIDPLVGANHDGTFTAPGVDPIRDRYHGLPRFVSVVGGAYFFLPSLPALRYLAALHA